MSILNMHVSRIDTDYICASAVQHLDRSNVIGVEINVLLTRGSWIKNN